VAFNTYSFGGSGFCIAAAHGVFLIYLCHVVFALKTSIAPLFSFAASFCLPDTSSGEYSPKLRPNRLNTLADALNTQQQLERHAEDQHGGAGRNDSERRVSRQILYCLFRGMRGSRSAGLRSTLRILVQGPAATTATRGDHV
jgi:hypothetical protein